MNVILKDGPADGRRLELAAGSQEHRVVVPKTLDVLSPFDPHEDKPAYNVGLYRFSGVGLVDDNGDLIAVVFTWNGLV